MVKAETQRKQGPSAFPKHMANLLFYVYSSLNRTCAVSSQSTEVAVAALGCLVARCVLMPPLLALVYTSGLQGKLDPDVHGIRFCLLRLIPTSWPAHTHTQSTPARTHIACLSGAPLRARLAIRYFAGGAANCISTLSRLPGSKRQRPT